MAVFAGGALIDAVAVNGGQLARHCPVHVDVLAVSVVFV
jgi:hypothetical protein